ncbi:alkaline phosphatase [Geothermobacter ehrlichii]|uniref:Alkaline phosphatase n=1 Tax=Geothermobacter ehrlichii TaxID=213224 RepID=A0A5D3WMS5_9BACT|nr:alkaline phosphatase [Geothermobacter ehrlichii]TYO98665.1 alkaline phosphatase [Geothermobacter ehrlichii]
MAEEPIRTTSPASPTPGLRLFFILLCGLLFFVSPGAVANEPARPRNLILMIGDGMGFGHLEAAGYWSPKDGFNPPFACFSFAAAMSTYLAGGSYDPERVSRNPDYLFAGATDSAAAATTLATGHKTAREVIGMARDNHGRLVPVENLLEAAEKLGKATGVITTVPISHATPAGFVAHNPSRKNYPEIAREMLLESPIDVVAGAGHPGYDDDSRPRTRPAYNYLYVGGRKLWQKIVAGQAGGDADGDGTADPWTLVDQRTAIQRLADGPTPKRLLLLAPVATTLQQKRSGNPLAKAGEIPFNPGTPTLAELTRATLNALDDDPDGLVLMIEGGAIDWAGHANQSGRMREELDDFAASVAVVSDWVERHGGWKQTLLIVTADHETGGLEDGHWRTTRHSNSLVPLLARGIGVTDLKSLADKQDPVHGPYLDNAELGRWLLAGQH